MENTLRVLIFALGFVTYDTTGNVLLCLAVGAIVTVCLNAVMPGGFPRMGYLALGLLAGMHNSAGDPASLSIIGLGLLVLGQANPTGNFRNFPSLIAGGILIASLASAHSSYLILGAGCLIIAINIKVQEKVKIVGSFALVACYGWLILCPPPLRSGNSVYLEQGRWATDSGDYGSIEKKLLLKNETTYSYAWMLRTIADRKASPSSLGPDDSTAWLVTPTTPFAPEEAQKLVTWIRQGGRLIVIADHTDYVGHARCLNQLTSQLNLTVHVGAFLPEFDEVESSQTFTGKGILTKTPTIATAIGAIPILSARGYFEKADYSKAGFFGPCTPSSDDRYGRFMTGGVVRQGLGTVTFWGDSTLFSNFSIFQPDSISTLAILNSKIWSSLPALACFILFALSLAGRPMTAAIVAATLLVSIQLLAISNDELLAKHENMAWSGDKNLVDDKYDPKASFSTIYALSSATGKVPRWTDRPEKEKGGIWVSEAPPPNGNWRWLTPYLEHELTQNDLSNTWNPVVRFVNPYSAYTKQPPHISPAKVDAGGLWTNEGVGSWWFGMGTATARIQKISAALEWLDSGKATWVEPDVATSTGPKKPCTVILDDGKRLQLSLPRINGKVGDYVYLGAGVSGLVTNLDGRIVISGSRDKDCFGYANSMKQSSWVMFYDEDIPANQKKSR
jgi:hypothetical protein